MKKLLLAAVIAGLSGCALIDAYLMKYDPNEYHIISDIRTMANLAKAKCGDPVESKAQADALANKTTSFVIYTQYTPHNDLVKKSSVELDKMAQGLKTQYEKSDKVSPAFCKIKFENVEKSAETIQKVVGDKPR
jgi:hypothetical protein